MRRPITWLQFTLLELGLPESKLLPQRQQVLKDMAELVLCCTDAEASNLGLFLQHTLSLMAHWRVR